MILINLSHPLTETQRADIEKLTDQNITRLVEQMVHFDVEQPFAAQAIALVDSLGLTSVEWQQSSLIIIPPALNFGTAAILAELHGRCGYFPPVVRTRPVADSLPPQYEVAEIVNLQAIRDRARKRR